LPIRGNGTPPLQYLMNDSRRIQIHQVCLSKAYVNPRISQKLHQRKRIHLPIFVGPSLCYSSLSKTCWKLEEIANNRQSFWSWRKSILAAPNIRAIREVHRRGNEEKKRQRPDLIWIEVHWKQGMSS